MSYLRNLQITIPAPKDCPNRYAIPGLDPHSEYSIRIQADQGWQITGVYNNHVLCALRLQRSSIEEERE
jgi:hypothetical protein